MSNHIPAAPDAVSLSLQQEVDELTQLVEKLRAENAELKARTDGLTMAELANAFQAFKKLRAEFIDALNRSASEIKDRDTTIERLGQKADAYDVLVLAIDGLSPRPSQGFREDVARAFQRRARQLMEEADARP